MKTLSLRKGEERRLEAGHLWIFANEVDTAKTPLKSFAPGEAARVESASGRPFGLAYVNPNSLICGRVLDTDARTRFDADFVAARLRQALTLREHLFKAPFYRLCFAEGDFLPGLVVDRFDHVLVVQMTTAGMETRRELVLSVLVDLLKPEAILLKNDLQVRSLEGLPQTVETALGQVPDEIEIEENGRHFVVPLASGQKTGWFFDQRDNRLAFARMSVGAHVLDAFSYVGAAGVLAASLGAASATCLDVSEEALRLVAANAALNGCPERVTPLHGDALTVMDMLAEEGKKFGAICLDPPAFIKSRKDQKAGEAAYARINRQAMRLIEDGGYLMSCSCSQHLPREGLRQIIQKAATQAKVRVQIIRQGHQAADHPVHPAMPETDYLKTFLVRVLR